MSETNSTPAEADPLSALPACVDELAARYSRPPLEHQIARARAEFDHQRGTVCDDEDGFENHVALFLQWYVIDRPLDPDGPPVLHALRQGGAACDPRLLRALASSQHALFEVLDPRLSRPTGVRVLDLVRGGLWRVDLVQPMEGLTRGDIFEGRVLPWDGRVRFGPVFCYHPRGAREAVHDIVRHARQQRWPSARVIAALARMKLKHSRGRNVPAERTYTLRALLDPRATPAQWVAGVDADPDPDQAQEHTWNRS